MPNKHFYFAVGATLGTCAVVWVHRKQHSWKVRYQWARKLHRWDPQWFLYFPFAIALFGMLPLIPDMLIIFDILPKEVVRSPSFNIFFGYDWFEKIEDTSPKLNHLMNFLASCILYGLSIGVMGFYKKELSRILRASCCR